MNASGPLHETGIQTHFRNCEYLHNKHQLFNLRKHLILKTSLSRGLGTFYGDEKTNYDYFSSYE